MTYVYCVFLLISLSVYAQEAEDANGPAVAARVPISKQSIEVPTTAQGSPQPSEQTSAADSATNTIKSKSSDRRNDDIFRPSEEISEDFAVSFPVDI